LYRPIVVPGFFQTAMLILGGAAVVHLVFVTLLGRLPRVMGWLLTAAYGFFLWKGLLA
jgi:cation:H+ antiporter